MIDSFKRTIRLMNRPERISLLLLLLVLLILALFEVVGIVSIMPFLAVATNPEIIAENEVLSYLYARFEFSSERSFLVFLGLLSLAILVIGNVLKMLNTWLTLKYHNHLNYSFARRLLSAYLARPYPFFLTKNTSSLGTNILMEANNVVSRVVSPATKIVTGSVVGISLMILLVVIDPFVALLIGSIVGGAFLLVYAVVRRKLTRIGVEQVAANKEKYRAAREGLSGIKDLKLLGREESFVNRFSKYAKEHAHNNVVAGSIAELPRFAMEAVAFGGIVLVVISLLGRPDTGSLTIPILAVYTFAGYRLMPALQQVFQSSATLRAGVASLDIVYEDLMSGVTSVNEIDNHRWEARRQIPIMHMTKGLELDQIAYTYPGSDTAALKSISLKIPSNASVAFVGPTGSGKTTVVDIVLGLLSPDSGALLVDGKQISASSISSWQENIGYVPQHIYLTDDTVSSNIAFGVPSSEIDHSAVRRAAKLANLSDFVENEMPHGYDSMVGERGVRLSGGQRQRIGIARALYKDPEILVLDEATSALDGITENAVMDAVSTLSRKKTIIMVAHRLTTVRKCDSIFLLEMGEVTSAGTYDELVEKSNWFREAAKK